MQIYPNHFSELDSTNRLLKELAGEGAPEGTLVSADRQTAGRGRLGRTFFSPEGGLYFSLLLRPADVSFETTLITTAAAVAMARSCDQMLGDDRTRVKWVNDIYRDGRKVSGILAEGVVAGTQMAVVLGIGVNLVAPAEGFPEDIAHKACALYETLPAGRTLSALREEFLSAFCNAFVPLYEALPDRAYLDDYRARMFLTGRAVHYEKDGRTHEAAVTGVADDGALLLLEKGEPVRLAAGEVSLTFEN